MVFKKSRIIFTYFKNKFVFHFNFNLMAKRPPNPHTQYGRKRILNEARQYNKSITPRQKQEAESFAYILVIGLVVVILLFLFAIGGTDAVLWWLKPKGMK